MSEASQSEHQTPAPVSQQTGEEETRPRRWWAALFWALLSPVAGYLYVGRIWRALFALLATLAIYAALQFDPTGLVATRFGFYALVAAALALTLYFLFDIVRSAIRRRDYRRRFWNHWLLYGAVVLLMFFAPDLATLQTELPRKGAEPFSIASASMRPTLPPGALFVVDRSVDPRADLKRGDVIVFRHPRTPSEIYVKRLIGLPGDQISLRDGVVSLNGAALAQTVVKRPFGAPALTPDERPGRPTRLLEEATPEGRRWRVLDEGQSRYDDMAPVETPQDFVFVLGDHRDNSVDSRFADNMGFVPLDNILGRATFVYFSTDWRRVGSRIK